MSKPLVLFISLHDWANSTYEAVRAINHFGEIEARHVTFWKHPWDFPTDILIDCVGGANNAIDDPRWPEVVELMQRADAIHLWNCEFSDFYNAGVHGPLVFKYPVQIPHHKVKSCTYAGTQYRMGHKILHKRITSMGIKIVVEDACFNWPNERVTFIPHAIDVNLMAEIASSGLPKKKHTIGVYNPDHRYDADIKMLTEACAKIDCDPPLTVVMDRQPIGWREHLKQLAECWFFFQSPNDAANPWVDGWFGRAALEACAMGIPTFSYYNIDKTRSHGDIGGLVNPAIINVMPSCLESALEQALNIDHTVLSDAASKWVRRYYDYEEIGCLYTDFFVDKVLEGEKRMTGAAMG